MPYGYGYELEEDIVFDDAGHEIDLRDDDYYYARHSRNNVDLDFCDSSHQENYPEG